VFRSLNVTAETTAREDAKERKHDKKGAG